jgi:subtilisin family serine protease
MFNVSTNQVFNRLSSNGLSTLGLSTLETSFLGSASVFDTEPSLREYRTSQLLEPRSSLLSSIGNRIKPFFFNRQSTPESTDDSAIASSAALDSYLVSDTAQRSALGARRSLEFGDGRLNAAAAVARSIGQPTFADVPDYGSNNWGLDRINAREVWSRGIKGQDVVVAVVDSGVDYTHPALRNNIWVNQSEAFGRQDFDDDGNGYVDDIRGWDFIGDDGNPDPKVVIPIADADPIDQQGHGTHVAGIIGAENAKGTVGVAYNSTIMPVRVFDEFGNTTPSHVAEGVRYAVNNGATIINLSLGGHYSQEVEAAVQYATERGALVVMAAGNAKPGESPGLEPLYPAHVATNWGIAVGSFDINNQAAPSSYRAGTDPNLRYVAAPGVNIWSTYPTGYGYKNDSGTSMAAPFVAGVAALMKSANPNLSPEQMRQILSETAIA